MSLLYRFGRYWLVAATVVIGLAVAALALSGQPVAARWTASVFTAVIAVYKAVGMIRQLFHGRWGIDILAVTAMISTVVVGEYVAALIIVLMIAGGEALEDYAAGRAKRELSALLDRAPQIAHVESSGQPVRDIPVGEVLVGDLLIVRPSEVVPVDGDLESEIAVFDESALTGESMPVERSHGAAVLSGSVNGDIAARLRVTARVEDSQYSRIVALVREASGSRAPAVRLADRFAVPFTAVAFLIAGAAWLISADPVRFADVLVVATPCPLLLAAPIAFLGGMSRAAHSGIIVKNAGTLERLSQVRTAVFDKTGTLTQGHPALDSIVTAGAIEPDRLLQLAASAEEYSSHVLAGSVIGAAAARGMVPIPAQDAQEHATRGVRARIGDAQVVVGKLGFVSEQVAGVVEVPLEPGQLAAYVGVDGVYAGALVMSDNLRDDAAATLAELRRLGVTDSLMLTGDARATAAHIAAQAGITWVQADCLPEDKVRAVAAVERRPVMMVGDGVNDAPVLAAADVGVAMGAKGSTAASESADVVIMLDDLSKVALAVRIGRRTIQIAVQSIWVGIGLCFVLMVFAAFGFIPAIVGALSQEAVDLLTILNALRALSSGRRAAESSGARPGRAEMSPRRRPRQWATSHRPSRRG